MGCRTMTEKDPKRTGVKAQEINWVEPPCELIDSRWHAPPGSMFRVGEGHGIAGFLIACPGCGRTTSTTFQELADNIQSYLRAQMPEWKKAYPGVEAMNVAVMGCIVNGPGESKHANIGISLPGTGESPAAPVFVDGQKTVTLRGEQIVEQFQAIVLDYVQSHYGKAAQQA